MYVVFGANGFLGRRVVARLAAEGLPVRAVSRRFDPERVLAAVETSSDTRTWQGIPT